MSINTVEKRQNFAHLASYLKHGAGLMGNNPFGLFYASSQEKKGYQSTQARDTSATGTVSTIPSSRYFLEFRRQKDVLTLEEKYRLLVSHGGDLPKFLENNPGAVKFFLADNRSLKEQEAILHKLPLDCLYAAKADIEKTQDSPASLEKVLAFQEGNFPQESLKI